MPYEQPFFKSRFHREPRNNDNESDHANEPAPYQHRAEEHEQDARIDRMPDKVIRTALNEFVPFFKHDVRTPIPTEHPARPRRNEQSDDRHRVSDHAESGGHLPENCADREQDRTTHQEHDRRDRKPDPPAVPPCCPFCCAFGEQRSDHPHNIERDPAERDDWFETVHFKQAAFVADETQIIAPE